MPQTKFVLERALESELTPIVIINKIDKPGARIAEVEDELADFIPRACRAEKSAALPSVLCDWTRW